jgi:Domain of unknown function (DUF4406)
MPRYRVYIAGPYTRPDPCVNTHRAVAAAQQLLDAGYAPFVPHLTHFWHTMIPGPREQWLELDLAFLPCCHAVLRLPGESAGADSEVREAVQLGIPVVGTVENLLVRFPPVLDVRAG